MTNAGYTSVKAVKAKSSGSGRKAVKPYTERRINTLIRFAAVHREAEQHFERYTLRHDARGKRFSAETANELGSDVARYLYANNMTSRIAVAAALVTALRAMPEIDAGPVMFVTIVAREYMVSMSDALAMTAEERLALVRRLQALVREALGGLPFIGMVEPGLYKGWGPHGPTPYQDWLFWHAHLLVWGHSHEAVSDGARSRIGAHCSIVGGTPVWVQTAEMEDVVPYALYLSKTPLKRYRIHRTKGEGSDPETGEIFKAFGYRQRKDGMRVGDRVLVANAMATLTLDRLLFGGGVSGRALVEQVKDAVLAEYRSEERHFARQREMRVSAGGFGPPRANKATRRKPRI